MPVGSVSRRRRVARKSATSVGGRKVRLRKMRVEKTVRSASKKSKSHTKASMTKKRVSAAMSITDLQFIAKSRGIPFGGLTKNKLARKINNYY